MTFIEMEQAVREAEADLQKANMLTAKLAGLLLGRLRQVRSYNDRATLIKLKRELCDFNAHSRLWREEG